MFIHSKGWIAIASGDVVCDRQAFSTFLERMVPQSRATALVTLYFWQREDCCRMLFRDMLILKFASSTTYSKVSLILHNFLEEF